MVRSFDNFLGAFINRTIVFCSLTNTVSTDELALDPIYDKYRHSGVILDWSEYTYTSAYQSISVRRTLYDRDLILIMLVQNFGLSKIFVTSINLLTLHRHMLTNSKPSRDNSESCVIS